MDNIRLARPGATDDEVRLAADRARVSDFVDELDDGWDTVLRSGGGRLSGGQRQRISIARAFLADARVIMLDEVTASLDAGNERAVVDAMTDLQEGRTVITVAHRIGSLTDAERILVLSSGRVVDEGSHEELLGSSAVYQQLWEDFVAVDSWTLAPRRGGRTPAVRPVERRRSRPGRGRVALRRGPVGRGRGCGHTRGPGDLSDEPGPTVVRDARSPHPGAVEDTSDSRVEFHDVWFSYGSEPVLRGVDMLARPGTVTALVAPSGAGKSTVANLVARFWDPDSGTVSLGGVDLREVAPDVRRDMVTTVYQDVYLFPDTVRANLTVGRPGASEVEISEALEAAEAAEFVDRLPEGLDTVLTEGGGNLSGGQRQRLSIARALLKDAPVLLLDEAVASVDPGTARRIQAALGRLAASRTVLVVAHRLNTIETADQIVVLDHGVVDGSGTHAELMESSGVYRDLQWVPV